MLKKFIKIIFKKNNKFIYYSSSLKINIWIKTIYLLFSKRDIITNKFTSDFASLIGEGSALSFASGRMAFFYVLKSLNLNPKDEIILQVPNCAVMLNAVIRTGATPVVVDVDLSCLGSDITLIKNKITKNTKAIVVQHTLGIPCNISEIVIFCKENNIILIEDCALSLSSKHDNIVLGNFGDYAIFSFDITKPINTIIGGILYSKNINNINILKKEYSILPELPKSFRFYILFNAFLSYLFSKRFNTFYNLFYLFLLKLYTFLRSKYLFPFLYDDNESFIKNKELNYPYPAKYSECFAFLGLISLSNWEETMNRRIQNKNKLLFVFKKYEIGNIPNSYFLPNNFIVPLRFAILLPTNSTLFDLFDKLYDRKLMWFISPLACNNDYEKFNISDSQIPNCLELNSKIINLPIDNNQDVDNLIKIIQRIHE